MPAPPYLAVTDSGAQSDASPTHCFHCGLPNPEGAEFYVSIDGRQRGMCCRGCQSVAQAIVDTGLGEFYKHRSRHAPTGRELVPDFLRKTTIYDNPEVQKSFVRSETGTIREASLILEGITCAACLWLNERHLAALPGVLSVSINYATHRARVRWDDNRIHLSEILQAVSRIGYLAHPYDPDRQQQLLEQERRGYLRRLGVAGVLGMQVMILAVALYGGDWFGMERPFRHFFSWLSLGLTLPVVLFAAQPFFRAAWRDLRHWQTGMDVPVTLGIGIAFGASAWATWQGQGHVYFDSVVMFVFFLLASRYFELAARKRAAETSEYLVHRAPAMAARLIAAGGEEREELIPAAELCPGDRVLIRPGDTVPADGRVLGGTSSVDESLLTGESLPLVKRPGQTLVGGSINRESPLTMEVEKTGPDTFLASMLRLLDRAQTEKPRLARLADRIAGWFVAAVLVLAAVVALYWWQHDAGRWLPITLAVLVATCPCALSLATPTAITAATGTLTRLGVLTTRGHALETLARATHFVFDKTGTLTEGRLQVSSIHPLSQLSAEECLRRAASLERQSEHPIARALLEAADHITLTTASEIISTPGSGLMGVVEGNRHYIGTPLFIQSQTGLLAEPITLAKLQHSGHTVVLFAEREELLAAFVLSDELRPGAKTLIEALKAKGKTVWLLTGDQRQAAQRSASAAGIDNVAWSLTPEDKLRSVQALQHSGAVVAMIGDGVNDAPVLRAAHVSIAMGSGTQLAAASADMILLSQRLTHLDTAVNTARKTLAIIRQNLIWAAGYNLTILPLAAAGYIRPWMAALGMSLSSLLVVTNAMRLGRHQRGPDD